MIKFEHTITPSPEEMEFVIEGMRNPMESWDKTDSGFEYDVLTHGSKFIIGPNDRDLMKRLCKAGSDERKFMRQMPVMVRITAPLYWWKEFDTYKVGTVSNSCSTMHKIHAHPFSLEDFSCEHLAEREPGENLGAELDEHGELVVKNCSPKDSLCLIINMLNFNREMYLLEKDPDLKKDYWWQLIQLLPSSYNQTRNITLNYEVLHNAYQARKYHKQDEWRVGFCDWCKTLPYSELITEE